MYLKEFVVEGDQFLREVIQKNRLIPLKHSEFTLKR